MFRWRKRNEGFEWREYVRTTILLRRQERRERVEDAKAAAVFGLKQAGRSTSGAAAGLAAAFYRGLVRALGALWSGLNSGTRALGRLLGAAAARLWDLTKRAGTATGSFASPRLATAAVGAQRLLAPLGDALAAPASRLVIGLIAASAAAGAAVRLPSRGIDSETVLAALVAIVCATLLVLSRPAGSRPLVPEAMRRALGVIGAFARRLPGMGGLRPTAAGAIVAALATGLVAGAWYWLDVPADGDKSSAGPSLASRIASLATSETVEGSASAVTGDTLRIAGKLVRLSGIEAPALHQRCTRRDRKSYDCGSAARDALARLLRGKRVGCKLAGGSADAIRQGDCRIGEKDLAGELVSRGAVFAAEGLFASYASLETQAREAKTGLWSGTAERPDAWRAGKWEEAKRSAPDGCPIKGKVSSGSKVYILPWSSAYAKARVNAANGERWFCSEDEAISAGWKPA